MAVEWGVSGTGTEAVIQRKCCCRRQSMQPEDLFVNVAIKKHAHIS